MAGGVREPVAFLLHTHQASVLMGVSNLADLRSNKMLVHKYKQGVECIYSEREAIVIDFLHPFDRRTYEEVARSQDEDFLGGTVSLEEIEVVLASHGVRLCDVPSLARKLRKEQPGLVV